MLQDVATAVAIVIVVLICNYECHTLLFTPLILTWAWKMHTCRHMYSDSEA